MNILYIIGNGFDLNLGLKTRYEHFYKYYRNKESDNANVQKLKENISNTLDSWSDLELALGSYTQHLEKTEELDDIMLDIVNNLSKYLRDEEQKLEKFELNQQKFFNYLSFPENVFLPTDKEKLINLKKRWESYQWNLDIYTFNYTSIIEKIFGKKQENVIIAHHNGNRLPIKLGKIKHIHGDLDKDMVIGVNDKSQIKNESFHDNRDILAWIVKSECNRANRNNIDRQFTDNINSANLICIFGSSIGDTDNKWWEHIGERLKSNCHLIIFSKGDEISPRIRHLLLRAERTIRDLFLGKTKLTEEEMEIVKENFFVGLNTEMFHGIMNKPKK